MKRRPPPPPPSLPASADGWGALPSPSGQRSIAAELLTRFGPLVLARSGLFKVERTSTGDPAIRDDGEPVLAFTAGVPGLGSWARVAARIAPWARGLRPRDDDWNETLCKVLR